MLCCVFVRIEVNVTTGLCALCPGAKGRNDADGYVSVFHVIREHIAISYLDRYVIIYVPHLPVTSSSCTQMSNSDIFKQDCLP
jgi:hypothetical protein